MDRMSFIPGKQCREYFHEVKGQILVDRELATSYAHKFILPLGIEYAVLSSQVSYCIGEGDELKINFGLRDQREGDEEFPLGELPGRTWATIKRAGKDEAINFFDVGRSSTPLSQHDATRAFNAYRSALAAYQGVDKPDALPVPSPPAGTAKLISRALSPWNLYHNAGVMWYFLDIDSIMPFDGAEIAFLQPMPARDALILSVLLTMCIGWPPGVYGVYQEMPLGQMPNSFKKESLVEAVEEPPLAGDEIAIIC